MRYKVVVFFLLLFIANSWADRNRREMIFSKTLGVESDSVISKQNTLI